MAGGYSIWFWCSVLKFTFWGFSQLKSKKHILRKRKDWICFEDEWTNPYVLTYRLLDDKQDDLVKIRLFKENRGAVPKNFQN